MKFNDKIELNFSNSLTRYPQWQLVKTNYALELLIIVVKSVQKLLAIVTQFELL